MKNDTMAAMTAKRPRVYFDADDELKIALELEALKEGKSVTQFIQDTFREQLTDSLREAKKIIEQRRRKKEFK